MAATDRPSRRRALVVVTAALVVAATVALRADRVDEVGALPPLPPGRAEVDLAVDARREDGGVVVALVLGVAGDAEEGVRVVDWGGDRRGGWSRSHPWVEEGGASPRWRWSPAVRSERPAGDQIVLHVGTGPWVDPGGIPPMEPPGVHVRLLPPGQQVGAEVWLDLARVAEVRVCVWAAGTGPGDPGARPAACADDRL